MSKFKPGDRVRGTIRPDIIGTVVRTDKYGVYLEVDEPVSATLRGKHVSAREGYVPEDVIELVEKSDWTSIWDDSSED